MVLVIALSCALATSEGRASSALPSGAGFGAGDRIEVERLRESLRKARPAQADSIGLALAVYALSRMPRQGGPASRDLKDVEATLKEACKDLPARTLAAVAAAGTHPIVSEAFCKAILRENAHAGEAQASSARAEAAAEASDAIHRFGATRGKALLEFAKERPPVGMGAGGASSSVYRIVAFVPQTADTGAAAGPILNGLLAGVEAGAGTWATRFRVQYVVADTSELGAARDVNRALDGGGVGVMVVAGGSNIHAAAVARAFGEGLVLLDARSPMECDPRQTGEFPSGRDLGLGLERTRNASRASWLPTYSDDLAYTGMPTGVFTTEYSSAYRPRALPVMQMRPPGTERGRRLAEVVRSRPEIRRVAIAIPEDGGDLPLATGFAAALRALGREVVVLEYAPGRRSYAAEATRFAESGAQAILLAGPGEESGEWLASLSSRKLKPLVLGSSELDPAGYHPTTHARIEGAIFVGDDWLDRPGELERRFAVMDPGPDRISDGPGADYRRGYRTGWLVSRSVLEGGYTPSSLARALERHSLKVPTDTRLLFPVRTSGTAPLTKPEEVVVPLYTVKNGEAVPLPGF